MSGKIVLDRGPGPHGGQKALGLPQPARRCEDCTWPPNAHEEDVRGRGGRGMSFFQKYELIEPVPGEGPKSFRARQLATGREVAVHLLVGGRTPQNEALLARLRALPAQSFSKLLEVGDNDGTPYVVIEAPPFR